MTSIVGQRVLVVGGSSGIGRAVAEQAAAVGARVTIASRSAEKLAAAAQSIGHDVQIAVLDTADATGIDQFFASQDAWHHVVISAAQTPSGPVRQLSLDDAQRAMESKFWGAYRVGRAAHFAEGGSLTFVSGVLSERPSPTAVLQGAINAALEGLSRGLALEFAPIRVNTVSPGYIDTPLWNRLDGAARKATFERIAASLPTKTIGRPADVANAVLFLMTTPFSTGSTVRVDGGGVIS